MGGGGRWERRVRVEGGCRWWRGRREGGGGPGCGGGGLGGRRMRI